MRSLRWLMPGMQVKRWLALLLAGVTVLGLGLAYGLIDWYQTVEAPEELQAVINLVTLQGVPQIGRALLFAIGGGAALVIGLYGLNRSLLTAVDPEGARDLFEHVDRRRRRRSHPRIVAIGGGTGLSTLLRGLKEHTDQITAIVTVADDGGSSGRLRRSLGVHPPGDFRQCIAALANTEPLMQRLFEYRFGDGSELGGHAFGNLFIVAMTGITGSFESALRASSRVLAVRGRILPSTLAHVTLYAELEDDSVMTGESNVPHGEVPIRRVFLEPADAKAYPEAIAAILEADLVVLGPGSLYTSVLPNLLVPDITEALNATRAPVIYVANVATQPGETDGYDLADHVDAISRHLARPIIEWVLANERVDALPGGLGVDAVTPHSPLRGPRGAPAPRVVSADLVDEIRPTRHDPNKLGLALMHFLRQHGRGAFNGRPALAPAEPAESSPSRVA